VADQGASTQAHARHAAAKLCRRATASRRGHPRVDAGAGAGRGVMRGLGQLRPAGQKRGRGWLVPPFPYSIFFEFLFPNIFSKLILTHLKSFSGFAPKTKFVTNTKFYNFSLS